MLVYILLCYPIVFDSASCLIDTVTKVSLSPNQYHGAIFHLGEVEHTYEEIDASCEQTENIRRPTTLTH